MAYFVIHSSEDGISIEELTAAQVLERITPEDGANYYGTKGFHTTVPPCDHGYFHTRSEDSNKLLIIEGRIVVPRAKTVVQEYEL